MKKRFSLFSLIFVLSLFAAFFNSALFSAYNEDATIEARAVSSGTNSGTGSGIGSGTSGYYYVYFNDNGGTGGSGYVTVEAGGLLDGVVTPTKTGYSFNGYYDQTTDGVCYINSGGQCVKAWDKLTDATLYARWRGVLTYDGNGATAGSMAQSEADYLGTFNLADNEFVKDGYIFGGWSETSGGSVTYVDGDAYYMYSGDATLYAVWYDARSGLGAAIGGIDDNLLRELNYSFYQLDDGRFYFMQESSVDVTRLSRYFDVSRSYAKIEEGMVALSEAIQNVNAEDAIGDYFAELFSSINEQLPVISTITSNYADRYKNAVTANVTKSSEGYTVYQTARTTYAQVVSLIVEEVKKEILAESKTAVCDALKSSIHACDGNYVIDYVDGYLSQIELISLDNCQTLAPLYTEASDLLWLKKAIQKALLNIENQYLNAINSYRYTAESISNLSEVYAQIVLDESNGLLVVEEYAQIDGLMEDWQTAFDLLKLKALQGSGTNSVQSASGSGFEQQVVLTVVKKTVTEKIETDVKNAVDNDKVILDDNEAFDFYKCEVLAVYDVTLTLNNVKYEYDGSCSVSIPLPDDFSLFNQLAVGFLNENGEMEYYDCVIVDNCLVFTTTHFSEYVVIGERQVSALWLILPAGLIAVLTAVYYILSKSSGKNVDANIK